MSGQSRVVLRYEQQQAQLGVRVTGRERVSGASEPSGAAGSSRASGSSKGAEVSGVFRASGSSKGAGVSGVSGVTGAFGVSGAGPVQSVDRAVAILEILARDGEAGVTEVARELDVHKSTASRLLAALDRRELVTQDTARGKFRLGVGIVRLAGAASQKLDVVQESRPVCRALAQQVGEAVNLAILSGRDALYLDQVAGPAALSPHNWAGQRIPLHATSDARCYWPTCPRRNSKHAWCRRCGASPSTRSPPSTNSPGCSLRCGGVVSPPRWTSWRLG